MLGIKEDKKELRKIIRERKKEFDSDILNTESISVFDQIEALPHFNEAKTILAYWSLPDEVKTHDFILKWYTHKTILLPLVVGENLELRVFSGMDCMDEGPAFGILEPKMGLPFKGESIDMAIIPGLAFDTKGNRLGRGKGYYDKLLKVANIFKVGVCFSFQLVDRVPTESFDVKMDRIIYSL
jgi:5-formyltetrahydrofolate cyclo-ligase